MNAEHIKQALIFKAFCDEKRLLIMELLRDGQKCACVISDLTGIKQSALSYHMKILLESGIVESAQDGKWINYWLSPQGGAYAAELLQAIITPNLKQVDNAFYLAKLEKPPA